MKILDTIEDNTRWIFDYLESKMSFWMRIRLDSLLFQVVLVSLIASIVIVIAGYILKSCGFSETVMSGIYAICTTGVLAYIIKALMPNIMIIQPVWMKILYVLINLAVVFLTGLITLLLVRLAIVIAIGYFILSALAGSAASRRSSGRKRGGEGQSAKKQSTDRECRYHSSGMCRHPESGGETCPCAGDHYFFTCRFRNKMY